MYYIQWDGMLLDYLEQYALDTGNDPREFTKQNIQTFKRQIQELGFSYDWDREVNTTDPEYYKWTQWIFIQLYNKGLAYVDEVLKLVSDWELFYQTKRSLMAYLNEEDTQYIDDL